VDRLRSLGLWNNHEENGIPLIYKTASEEARAALLAGFIDTDGCLVNGGTAYTVSQSIRHRQLIEDMLEVAIGLGIKVGRLRQYWAPDPASLVNDDEQDDDSDHRDHSDHSDHDEHGDRTRTRTRNRGFEQLAFGMFGPNLAKLQSHIALARKRVHPS
jgi:hypothetical protein